MKTELINVTPKMAREWLKHNSKNRGIRPSHVETLRLSFERGEYVMSHQGIAFGDDGELIDGQHRLQAIAQLEGGTYPMLVSRGLDRETVFGVVDATQAKRTTSDVLGLERHVGECANFFAKLYAGRTTGITPVYAKPFAEWISPELDDLMAFCSTSVKTWSSAPVRCAAVISMKRVDPDYVKLVYRSMVLLDYDTMPPIAKAICRQWTNGTVRAAGAYDIFARGLKLFDPKMQKLKKVQVNDANKVVGSVRDILARDVIGKKRGATLNGGAKGVSGANYRINGL